MSPQVETGGEDAYFIMRSGRGACGVADGVGSWVMDGVNPAEFPRCVSSLAADLPLHHSCNSYEGVHRSRSSPASAVRSHSPSAHVEVPEGRDPVQQAVSAVLCRVHAAAGTVVGVAFARLGW